MSDFVLLWMSLYTLLSCSIKYYNSILRVFERSENRITRAGFTYVGALEHEKCVTQRGNVDLHVLKYSRVIMQ